MGPVEKLALGVGVAAVVAAVIVWDLRRLHGRSPPRAPARPREHRLGELVRAARRRMRTTPPPDLPERRTTSFEDLDGWFARARDEYTPRKRAAEAAVIRWEWATGATRSLAPFHFERSGFAPGKPLTAPPVHPGQDHHAYGFDDAGRLLVERNHAGIVRNGARTYYETFYEHLPDRVDAVAYHHDPSKEVVNVQRARWEAGQLAVLASRAQAGARTERYTYENGRLVQITAEGEQWAPSRTWRHVDTLQYDAHGGLVRIERAWSGELGDSVQTLYRRLAEGESFESFAREVEERLLTLIPGRVAALGLSEPAYALVLAYDSEGNDLFPPAVGVGLERERAAVLAEQPDEARHLLWNPAEFSWYERGPLVLDDAALDSACERLNELVRREERWDDARELLLRVARRLQSLDWGGRLPVTDDFLALANDYEQSHLSDNLRATAAPEVVARLEQRGLVP